MEPLPDLGISPTLGKMPHLKFVLYCNISRIYALNI